MENLNRWIIEDHETGGGRPFVDYSMSTNARVDVCFRGLEDKVVSLIQSHTLVVGCVAWLTNPRILKALSEVRDGVSLIVQKEDFLRPDESDESDDWASAIRRMYNALPYPPERHLWREIGDLSYATDPSLGPVRCAGEKIYGVKNCSQMHNKFLVFCDSSIIIDEKNIVYYEHPVYWNYQPKVVWTGSFNFTQRAIQSLENAVILHDEEIAEAYFSEWAQIMALSEPLDWTSEYVEPEWRIGT